MTTVRVIPCLDVKEGRVVKGVKFENIRDARDIVQAATAYESEGADELVILDIAATIERRGTQLEWVKQLAANVTIPFAVGGGFRTVDDMQALFDVGAFKVSVNTAAVKNPDLVRKAASRFGAKKVVVAIDGKKNHIGSGKPRLEVVVSGGHESTSLDIVEWARQVEHLGAGEILLTSKDADGTKDGYDIEMTRAVAEAVGIPVIASGGVGTLEHLYEVVSEGKAAAVLAASVFHFGELSVRQAKEYLASRGVHVAL